MVACGHVDERADRRPRASHPGGGRAGTLLTLVAFTAPLATLNSTAAALGAGVAGRTWVLSSMSIGLGAALLSAGTTGRRLRPPAHLRGRARRCSPSRSLAALLAADVVLFVMPRVLQGSVVQR